MNLDLQIEGKYSQRTEDLQNLKQSSSEEGMLQDAPNEHAVSVLRTLTITLGMLFSIAMIILFKPAMAFIYVTLTLGTSSTMAIGSEKIITFLPERIWTKK